MPRVRHKAVLHACTIEVKSYMKQLNPDDDNQEKVTLSGRIMHAMRQFAATWISLRPASTAVARSAHVQPACPNSINARPVHVYRFNRKLIVPTVKVHTEGFYVESGIITVFDESELDGVVECIAVQLRNTKDLHTSVAREPWDVPKAAGANSQTQFYTNASMLCMELRDGVLRIEPQATSRTGGFENAPGRERSFPIEQWDEAMLHVRNELMSM